MFRIKFGVMGGHDLYFLLVLLFFSIVFLMGKGKYIMSCRLYDIKYMSFACFAPGFCSMYYIFRLLYSAVLCICDSILNLLEQ